MLHKLNIFETKYQIIETLRLSAKKALFSVHNNCDNRNEILKAQLIDFVTTEKLNIYKTIKKNPHCNINKINSIYQTEKLLLTIKENIDGFMIIHLKNINVSDSIILSLLIGTLKGLQHLHSLGIAHGDISPFNIMIKNKNNVYVPVIIDFDHSILLNNKFNDTNSCSCGTLGFVPPEHENKIRNDKSDIWALGQTFKTIFKHVKDEKLIAIAELMTVHDYSVRPSATDLLELLE